MRVLVTGATGFVGSNLAAALAERGDEVRVLRRASSRMTALAGVPVAEFVGDILEPSSLEAALAGCDAVFHAAAISRYWLSSRDAIYRVNVEGTRNVLAAARAAGVKRLVYTSSVAALGYGRRGEVLDETHAYPAELEWWPYGHSKHLAEKLVCEAADGLHAVIVNPTMVLGPRDVNFVSATLIQASLEGKLRAVPPGGANFVHVADVVEGHIAAALEGRPGQRYLLGGENLSYRDMARIAGEVTGGPGPVLVLPRWTLPPIAWAVDGLNRWLKGPPLVTGERVRMSGETLYVSTAKAARELGLHPRPFRQAVEDTYRWCQDRQKTPEA